MKRLLNVLLSAVVFLGVALAASNPAFAQEDTDRAEAIVQDWLSSPHADASAEAFVHWDEEGEIPGNCAVCHSGEGFQAFLGADMSMGSVIDHPVPVGTVINCDTCHAEGAQELSSVTFPSGETVTGIESGGVCMVCHQGRESTVSVNMSVADMSEDEVNPELGFVNVHYRAAAASLMGTKVKGAYEYDGREYMGQFDHVPEYSTCTDCHDPHSLQVKTADCAACHETDTPEAIRISETDFDGNGDMSEGIAAEIVSVHEALGEAIWAYSAEVAEAPVIYAEAYPYFFADSNGDGVADPDEAVFPNRYASWTPRLLKAAYNYQFVAKDPGAYAHNPHYVLQILYDSIESLSQQADIDMASLTRP